VGVSVPMLYAIACGDHRPAGAQSGREYRISRSLPKITSYSHLPPDDLCVRRARVAVAGPRAADPPTAAQQNEAAPPAERAAAGVGFRVVARSTVPVRGTRTMQWRGRADSDSRGSRPHACSIGTIAWRGPFWRTYYSDSVRDWWSGERGGTAI